MGTNSEFLIPFKGLENGIHNYRFQVSSDFFEKFENSRIQNGNYEVDLILDKRDQMIILDFTFEGQFEAACDRCLANIDIPSFGEDQIVVKLKEEEENATKANIVFIEPDAHILDVSGFINIMIHLHLPLINERDCESEAYKYCDHDILDKIEGGETENEENSGNTWDALKDLNLD